MSADEEVANRVSDAVVIRPGDRLVITMEDWVTGIEGERFLSELQSLWPDVTAVLLIGAKTVAVIHADQERPDVERYPLAAPSGAVPEGVGLSASSGHQRAEETS